VIVKRNDDSANWKTLSTPWARVEHGGVSTGMKVVKSKTEGETQHRPAGYHHGNLRAALLDVALKTLAEKGAAALSLRAIARQAGVSQTAPYNHFADKEALLAALATVGYKGLSDSMAQAVVAAAPVDTASEIRALGRGYLDFAIRKPEQLRLMFGGEIVDMREFPELMAAAHDAFAAINTAVERFIDEGNTGPTGRMGPNTATIAAWSMVHGLSTLLIDHKVNPAETEAGTEAELIEQILDIFVDALKKNRDKSGPNSFFS
jgi:AcrR family transcriptional regulator